MDSLWIARDGNGELYVYQLEPYLELMSSVFDCDGDMMELPRGAFPELATFHKVKMLIGEKPIECTPKTIPELWLLHRSAGGFILLNGPEKCSGVYFEFLDVRLSKGFKCRVAWDENGIRLIGEPQKC